MLSERHGVRTSGNERRKEGKSSRPETFFARKVSSSPSPILVTAMSYSCRSPCFPPSEIALETNSLLCFPSFRKLCCFFCRFCYRSLIILRLSCLSFSDISELAQSSKDGGKEGKRTRPQIRKGDEPADNLSRIGSRDSL